LRWLIAMLELNYEPVISGNTFKYKRVWTAAEKCIYYLISINLWS
jgi:hypothetical protein